MNTETTNTEVLTPEMLDVLKQLEAEGLTETETTTIQDDEDTGETDVEVSETVTVQ